MPGDRILLKLKFLHSRVKKNITKNTGSNTKIIGEKTNNPDKNNVNDIKPNEHMHANDKKQQILVLINILT